MPHLRVETARYQKTGKVYAELYYPEYELIPIAVTEPIYLNREDAVQHATETFKVWMTQFRKDMIDL
jgi:hypothetical protein